jgi:hypothetical protein
VPLSFKDTEENKDMFGFNLLTDILNVLLATRADLSSTGGSLPQSGDFCYAS